MLENYTEGSKTQNNLYNGNGQRVQKKEGSNITNYYYQEGSVLYTDDGSGNMKSFNLLNVSDAFATSRKSGTTEDYYTYTEDMRGSTINLLDNAGSIDKSETCDYLKWATLGMGRKEMRAPEGIPLRCELVMMFPPEINIDNFNDDYRGDVMGWISHYPYLNNDWIGEKRIVDGEDVLPDELPYRGMTFFTIKDSNGQPLNVEISKGEKVAFYYVVPLFRSELEYAKTHSEEELFKLLLKIENPYIFDANREPVV